MDWLLLLVASILVYIIPGLVSSMAFDLRSSSWIDRLALALVGSQVLVPFAFVSAASLAPFRPGPVSLAVLLAALAVAAIWVRRRGSRPRISFWSRPESGQGPDAGELRLSMAFIFAFAAVANAPRLAMLLQGGQTPVVATFDEHFHLAQLTAVAGSGLPPQHYSFPSADLSYYYWSWVSPATVGNFGVPLARAMSVHGFFVVLSFLTLIYALLLRNVGKRSSRLIGLAFFTVVGGFDLYAAIGSGVTYDWWQTSVGWLESGMQISQFMTSFIWVPHHLSAATAVLLFFYAARHLRFGSGIWLPVLALLLCFAFGASPWVLIAFTLMLLVYLGLRPQSPAALWSDNRRWVALAAALIALGCWRQVLVGLDRETGLAFSSFRVPLLEAMLGTTTATVTADRLFTLAASPLILGAIYLIEFGLPFLLYLGWLTRRPAGSDEPAERRTDRLLAIYPLLFAAISILFTDVGGAGNLSLRGVLPGQVLIVFAGVLYFDSLDFTRIWGWRRTAVVYLMGAALVLQALSAAAEWRARSLEPLRAVFGGDRGGAAAESWQPQFRYIPWLNANTPAASMVIELGCPQPDGLQYRLLERARQVDARCAPQMQMIERDKDFLQLSAWREIEALGAPDVLALAADPELLRFERPVYVVSRMGAVGGGGPIVYEDDNVVVARLR